MKSKLAIALTTIVLTSVVVGGAALAGGAGLVSNQPADEGALLAPVTRAGKAQAATKVVTETVAQSTSTTTYATLPGALTTISVPSRQRALVIARFSGESYCDGGTTATWCTVRIMIGGAEGHPASGSDYAFDTDSGGDDWWEAHAVERVSRVLNPGTYTVRVQWAVTDALTTFRLDDWTLVVERIKL